MEERFLENWMQKIDPSAERGSHVQRREPWYNPHGDCIQFQTVNEAAVAERIDNYLTIYRSALTDHPIGFKIKDVRELIKKYGCDGIGVEAEIHGQILVRVTGLLLRAYQSEPPTISRVSGYASALEALTFDRERENVAIPA
jgi:hypothetical protein